MRASWLGLAVILVAAAIAGAGDEPAKAPPLETAPVVCGAGGVEASVALAYQLNAVGPVAATYVDLGFDPPLDLPSAAQELRSRLTSLLPQGVNVGSPTRQGKRLRVALTTAEQGIQPANAFKMRFDCPAGSRIAPGAFSCSTAEVTAASGQPLDDALAREVRCVVFRLDPVRR
jgi:hypothetical protein